MNAKERLYVWVQQAAIKDTYDDKERSAASASIDDDGATQGN